MWAKKTMDVNQSYKKPGFFNKKKTVQWVFLGFSWVFWVFWVFWFFFIYLPRRESFLGFFQFQEYY
jgi:hypothetical protein